MGVHRRVSGRAAGAAEDAGVARGAGKAAARRGVPGRPPTQQPPFTLADLRRAVPKHCFERSYARSFYHVAEDLFLLALLAGALWAVQTLLLPLLPSSAARLAQWVVYPAWIYAAGTVMTGLWVLAHECGHQAFSPSTLVNDSVGLVLHSALLVPYHSWRISHGNHHSNTGSVENDEVFVPSTREQVGHSLTESPLVHALEIVNMLLLGWPGYLIFNLSGPTKYHGVSNSHFAPSSALFSPRDFWLIVLSDAALLVVAAALISAHLAFGHLNVLLHYWLPYLVVNYHLVLITYLQHTDVYIPHYDSSEWNWLRGALATVDRSFGGFMDRRLHRIADLHVCHHIFSYMPFYHHEEATRAMEPVLGSYRLQDDTPIAAALWRSWTHCKFVEAEPGTDGLWYKHKL